MSRLLWLLLLVPGITWSQAFPLFDPATGILKGQNNTYVTTAAVSSDVISLWTATCNSTTFLRGDGQCQTPSGSGIGTVTSVALTVPSGFSVSGSPVTSEGTLAITGTLNVSAGGTGATTLTGLLEGSGTSAINPAEVTDVITLWTGTCDATTFLRGDGSCQSAAGTSGNPTASIGLSAVNGVATTFMRSDAAPALSQAITPNWSATHRFSGGAVDGVGNSFPIDVDNSKLLAFRDSSAGFTNVAFIFQNSSNQLALGANAGTQMTISSAATNVLSTGFTHNGNSILDTTSSLNGSNVTTGTVAAARLPNGVAYKDSANQEFSVVGNNALRVINSSTGAAFFQVQTNGVNRVALCSGTTSGSCVSDSAANDSVLTATQTLRLSANNGTTSQVVISPSQTDINSTTVNLNATTATVSSSRINTIVNSGKVAFGRVSSAGVLSNSLNVTSASRSAIGSYLIDLTAAGFSSSAVCNITTENIAIDGALGGTTTTSATVSTGIQNAGIVTATDVNFHFSCRAN